MTGINNNCLHEYILDSIDKEFIAQYFSKRVFEDNEDFFNVIFSNYRFSNNTHLGIRLTFFGSRILKKRFSYSTHKFTDKLTNGILVTLDKNMIWPYYISNGEITFFSDVDASWFVLNGNNLTQFVDYI